MNKLVWVCAVLALSSVAQADTKAWTAAKKVLPAGLPIIASLNVGAVRTTQTFQALWPLLQDKMKDMGEALSDMKTACAFDPAQGIDSLVVAGSDEGDDTAVLVLSFKMAQSEIESCFVKAQKARGNDVKIGKDGAYAKYAVGGNAAYARWLDRNTVAVAIRIGDKDFLGKMTAGGIAKDKALSGVKTDSQLWVVVDKASDVDQIGAKMTRAYGSANIKAGKADADLHFVLDSSDAATATAKKVQGQLDAAKASGQMPAQLDWLFKSLTISPIGTELVVRAGGTDQNIVDLLKLATQ
jgi:hypothetical protein